MRKVPLISSLNILSYRGLENMELSNLSRINIIVGQNNSGKTSLLEAIQLLSNPFSSTVIRRISRQRELHRRYIRPNFDRNDFLFWMFPNKGDKFRDIKINYCMNDEETTLEFKGREMYYEKDELENYELIENSEDIFEKYMEIDVCSKSNKSESKKFTLFKNNEHLVRSIEDYENFKPNFNCSYISSIDHKSSLISANLIEKVFDKGQKEKLLQMIKKFDSNIENILIESDFSKFKNHARGSEIFIEHKINGKLPLFVYGDGMQKILLIATKVIGAHNGILLIDEIETGIHTELLNDYFQWLYYLLLSEDITLFASTHSLEAVDAIINHDNLENISLYRILENSVKYFSGEKVYSLRNNFGQDVRY